MCFAAKKKSEYLQKVLVLLAGFSFFYGLVYNVHCRLLHSDKFSSSAVVRDTVVYVNVGSRSERQKNRDSAASHDKIKRVHRISSEVFVFCLKNRVFLCDMLVEVGATC